MPRLPAMIILSVSPLILTIALCIVAYGINAVGRAFGNTKSPSPVVIAAVFVWLLHAGFLLGPWLYHAQRQALALWLMIPVAIIGIITAILIAKQIVPGNADAINGKFVVCCILWTLAVIFGYLAPLAVMLSGPPALTPQAG